MAHSTSSLAAFDSSAHCQYHRGHALSIKNLSLSHGGRLLFHSSQLVLKHGSITGLVGVNGAGKTSLAKILASKEIPGCPSLTVEYLSACEDEEDETRLAMTPLEYIQARINDRLEELKVQIDELEDTLQADNDNVEETADCLSDLYDVEESLTERMQRECQKAIDEIGLSSHTHKRLSLLSSGWRYKCRLVATFLVHPDLLIIDEPSFLDLASTEWFENQMQAEKAMVVLISHKEALLETLCDGILYINAGNQTLTYYHGNYYSFRSARQAEVDQANRTVALSQDKLSKTEDSLDKLQTQLRKREKSLKATTQQNSDQRFIKGKNKEAKQKADRSAASKLKQVKRDTKRVQEMRQKARQERVKPLHIDGMPADGTAVALHDVGVSFDDMWVFRNVDIALEANDRVLLSGPNGVGKTTLVKVILGELDPSEGSVSRKGSFLYFPQMALGQLAIDHGKETALDCLGGGITETLARQHLGDFGLSRDLALRPIYTLSAGQRVRLWLAKRLLNHPKPALLVLDEISENVDVETRKSLVDMLDTFEGAALVVSHDPDFCDSFRHTKVWELSRNGIKVRFA